MGTDRLFPIQDASPIPWACAERAYQTYLRHGGRGQSLERLAERGGFGLQEFACLFAGHEPQSEHRECIDKADALGRRLAELEGLRKDAALGRLVRELPPGYAIGQDDNVPDDGTAETWFVVRKTMEHFFDPLAPVEWTWISDAGTPEEAIRLAMEPTPEEAEAEDRLHTELHERLIPEALKRAAEAQKNDPPEASAHA